MHKRICNYCYPWQTPTEEISHLALTSWVPTCRAEDTNDPDRMSYTLEWCSCYDEATAEQSPNRLLFMPLIGFFDFTRRLNKTPKKRLHAVTKHYSKWQWMKALWFWQQKYVSQIHWCCSFVMGIITQEICLNSIYFPQITEKQLNGELWMRKAVHINEVYKKQSVYTVNNLKSKFLVVQLFHCWIMQSSKCRSDLHDLYF